MEPRDITRTSCNTSKPTGGILNSLTLIPEYLAKKGHEVFVSSSYPTTETVNGVQYVANPTELAEKWDVVTVFNRDVLPKPFVQHCKERGIKTVWWLHDIVQTTYLKDDAFRAVDKVVALSTYCKDTYSEFYQIDSGEVRDYPERGGQGSFPLRGICGKRS